MPSLAPRRGGPPARWGREVGIGGPDHPPHPGSIKARRTREGPSIHRRPASAREGGDAWLCVRADDGPRRPEGRASRGLMGDTSLPLASDARMARSLDSNTRGPPMGLFDRLRANPSPEKFASLLIRALRSAGVTEDLRYDGAEDRITWSRGGEPAGVTNLGNMYAMYVGNPGPAGRLPPGGGPDGHGRQEGAARRTRCGTPRHPGQDLDPIDHRAPASAGRDVGGPGRHRLRPRGRAPPRLIAYDSPESVQSINRSNLEAWGVTIYEALEVARARRPSAPLRVPTEGMEYVIPSNRVRARTCPRTRSGRPRSMDRPD